MKMTKEKCNGCRNNFYNDNNPLGVKECWSFKSAKLENRIVLHKDQPPPYKSRPTMKPNCWHGNGYIAIKPDVLTKKGFWK